MMTKALFRSIPFVMALFLSTASQTYAANEVPLGLGPLTLGGAATSIGINTGYFQGFSEMLQVGGTVSYQTMASKGVTNKHLMLLVGPQFNLLAPYPEAMTIHAGLAWRKAKTDGTAAIAADNASGLGFGVTFGKRFPLVGNLILHPTAGVVSAGTFSFIFVPVRVSLNF